ncbi:MAG: AAA family ATPase [Thermodesulfobacteriota bacterium]|nr:AAA family ATPase [Thermodesulfobacteriota bacterium]
MITGARQTGKTTLASKAFEDHLLLSMDDPMVRPEFSRLTARDWINRYPLAVIDEIQKLPALMESIKACYDSNPHVRYVLLGSSQIMLLKGIRESLAGRAAIQELYPLTLPELMTTDWSEPAQPSRLIRWLSENSRNDPLDYLEGVVSINERYAVAKQSWEYYLNWGGMPALTQEDYTNEDRRKWLEDYFASYLQRDLSDLGRLNDLEPFVRAQQAIALRTSKLINFTELGRLAGVSSPTAKKFMRYLELSYQLILLPAFFRNPEKRLAKQPKAVFLDPGVRRGILRKSGVLDGLEWESAVIAEIFKQVKTADLPIILYHLRTLDGRELDLLLESEQGFIAIECKMTTNPSRNDFQAMRNLTALLDKPLLAGLVVCNEDAVRRFDADIPLYSVPCAWLLS